ncbi:MAG: hypothetical protein L0191_17795 [Acidobacteria bacterium]|nr:hypothetical protein [Acidobacteriota bacterium]
MSRRRPWHTPSIGAWILVLLLGTLVVAAGGPARADSAVGELRQVTRLPVLWPKEFPDHQRSTIGAEAFNGSLLLDSRTRRAYQAFFGNGHSPTFLQSFDLDSLRPIRSGRIDGVPI